jgi:hypothetical protein
MRIPALMMLTVAAALTAMPARAQTYDPAYPVCIQIYNSDGGRIQCGFNSLAQCAASAAGGSAQCITNPYFGGARAPAERRQRGAY